MGSISLSYIIVGVIFLLFVWIIYIYNKLIRLIEAVDNNEKQIDIQLDRRFKVFESLINVVKKAMDFEKTTLTQVVELRNQSNQAKATGDSKARMTAENAISKIAGGINVIFEQYPDLKSNTNAMQLQEEIVNTENKLTFAKQAFNDSIEQYNVVKKSFFESIIVSIFSGRLDKDYAYWHLEESDAQKKEDYSVKF